MALVTKAEIIAAVFTRSVTESRIQTDLLEVVQHKYLRPILGEDFYDAVIASPSSYTALLTYIKPVLFWYAKYLILPELRYEISDLGTNQLQIDRATPLTDEGFAMIRDQALIIAEEKVKILNEYLYDNMASYPLYYISQNSAENVSIVGGIIMRKKDKDTDYFEDSSEHWK